MESLGVLIAYIKAKYGGGGGGDITVEAFTATDNGTFTAPTGKAYSPVTVSIPSASGVSF
jgi:hypothetical protein